MPAAIRAYDAGSRLGTRFRRDIGEEFRERRLELGHSQKHVAGAARMSRMRLGQIERGVAASLTVDELCRLSAVLGLSPSIRVYPGGGAVRDAGHARRLGAFVALAAEPLRSRVEVGLPRTPDHTEQRAWDAVLVGGGERTAIELEMRIRDAQAMRRRIDLKRRDDPHEHFLLLVADTRHNRRVLTEFRELFVDLPTLRLLTVRKAVEAGMHPPTGLLFV